MRLDKLTAAWALVLASATALFWPVLVKLVADWANDDNYSHGFFIVPLAVWFAWERRDKLAALPVRPSPLGLIGLAGSIAVLLAGLLGAELFLSRVALIGVVISTVLFLYGWRHLRVMAFPIAFLLLMIPLPSIIFNQIAFPLQLWASQAGEVTMKAFSIPVLREGNVMILANTSLEVAEACSGIRSLVSLLTLGIVYGYFIDPRGGVRVALALSTIPIAIVTNAARVAGTGIAAHYYGPEVADGFFHTFSGWLVFVAGFVLLFTVARLLHVIAPPRESAPPLAPVSATA